jgi:hypothetical protein
VKSIRQRARWVVGTAIVMAVIGAGVAYAAIPDSSGVIHGCYSKTGALSVIDSSQTCGKGTTTLDWNQSGQQGPKGDTGPAGAGTVLFAVVTTLGTLTSGSPGTSSSASAGGARYVVHFAQDVSSCAAVATIHDVTYNAFGIRAATIGPADGDPNDVEVDTFFSLNGGVWPAPFELEVAC